MSDSMRLVLSEPVGDRKEADVAPGLAIRVSDPIPLPPDLEAWYRRVIDDAVVVDLRRVIADAGWPVTIVHARAARAGETAHVLHAFYELFDRGVVVTVIARDAACLGDAVDKIHTLLRAADIDRSTSEVVALAQLWEEP